MATPLIISGHCYVHGSTTPIENAVITVENMNTNEEHNGAETPKFTELTTNSEGEFQCNLANFDIAYSDGDVIKASVNYNGQRDETFFTISGTTSTNALVLTPMPNEDVYDYERALDKIGSQVVIYHSTIDTLDDDHGSVETETITQDSIGGHVYASIQIEEDEETMEEQGIVKHGVARGFFKVRYNISKGDKIRVPSNSDNYWAVADKPIRHYYKNQPHHDEARLVRLEAEVTIAAGTTPVIIYKDGSDCSGSDGELNRVLTITTDSTPSNIKVTVDGTRVRPDVHYTVSTTSTSIILTFDNIRIFDTQYISVDYFI